MKVDTSRAFGAYAGIVTIAAIWLALTSATSSTSGLPKILDVERINVREPDGTLRMVIGNTDVISYAWVDGRAIKHPNRSQAGMIFLNDEGTETGGLIFDGRLVDGKPTSAGSLTFDRWRQDQTVQLYSDENGSERSAGIRVNDQPDAPMDLEAGVLALSMPDGPARLAALRRANLVGGQQRAFLGRSRDGSAQLTLRDGAGRGRMVLKVEQNGSAAIQFLDESGAVKRTIDATD